jgi:hypothetical protein
MLPDGLFSFLAMPNTKRKKRLTDDGVQIIWYTCVRPVYYGLCLQAVVTRSTRCPPALAQRPLRHDSAQRTGGATEPPTGGVPFCGPPPSKKRRFGHDGPRTRLEHSRNRSARPLAMLRLEYFRQKLTRRLPTSDRRCPAKCFRRPLSSADVQKARASPALAARRSGA